MDEGELKKMVREFYAKHPGADKARLRDLYELACEEVEDTSLSTAIDRLAEDLKEYEKEL